MRKAFAIALPGVAGGRADARSRKWMVLGRDRSRPHFARKFYHMAMGVACFLLYAYLLDRQSALWCLAIVGGLFVVLDVFRLRFPRVNDLALGLFGKVMRREELRSISGNSFFVLGLFVVAIAFPKPIGLLSVLYLAFGDPVAAMAGTLYGRHRIVGRKSLEGSLANFVVSMAVTLALALGYLNLPVERAMVLAVVGAMASTVAELVPLPIDDNFTIPVVSGLLLLFVSAIYPLF